MIKKYRVTLPPMGIIPFVFCVSFVIGLMSCATPPTNALLVNNLKDAASLNKETFGYLAFAPDTSGESYIRADVLNNSTGETFRLLLTPQRERNGHPPVIIYQMPPGDYHFTQLYSGFGDKPSMTNINRNPFYITKGIVTSMGRLSISVEEGFRLKIKNISVVTVHQDIDETIQKLDAQGVEKLNIRYLELSLVR